ncbi:hypothetical protein VSA01S_00500 [Vibrio sagamiensis NBRC 104589]|uniref:Uncharacterized protein n=1 Tax=Vibrio sagamiensis NBRC 104589 TaxID=1219064 RepID=A0A511Q9M5_9VIBR|nr:hypothetical protein VSA01S_00500 [Vibrio sagamiensis NBRC 104589]
MTSSVAIAEEANVTQVIAERASNFFMVKSFGHANDNISQLRYYMHVQPENNHPIKKPAG